MRRSVSQNCLLRGTGLTVSVLGDEDAGVDARAPR
jgi:hypothetical protein